MLCMYTAWGGLQSEAFLGFNWKLVQMIYLALKLMSYWIWLKLIVRDFCLLSSLLSTNLFVSPAKATPAPTVFLQVYTQGKLKHR